MNKKAIIYGGVFGLLAPLFGVFVGLQVNPFVGTLLLLPVIGMSIVLGDPIGMFGTGTKILAIGVSVVFWIFVFIGVQKMINSVFR